MVVVSSKCRLQQLQSLNRREAEALCSVLLGMLSQEMAKHGRVDLCARSPGQTAPSVHRHSPCPSQPLTLRQRHKRFVPMGFSILTPLGCSVPIPLLGRLSLLPMQLPLGACSPHCLLLCPQVPGAPQRPDPPFVPEGQSGTAGCKVYPDVSMLKQEKAQSPSL